MRLTHFVTALAFGLAGMALASAAHAGQELQFVLGCKSGSVQCTVSSSGGTTDVFARAYAEFLRENVKLRLWRCNSNCFDHFVMVHDRICALRGSTFVDHDGRPVLSRNVIHGLPSFVAYNDNKKTYTGEQLAALGRIRMCG